MANKNEAAGTLTHKQFSADIAIAEDEKAVVATMTTSTVDRDGEILQVQGMNATHFEKNPVVMLSHSYSSLPIGKVTAIKRGQGKWSAKIVFADRPEDHPVADEWIPSTIYSLFKQGVMNAVSIGLIPKEVRPATEKDIKDFGPEVRRVVSKYDLLELSVCAIPCNPEAVVTAVGKSIITQEVADKLFGKIEPKAEKKDDMITCSDCGEEFPADQMQGDLCQECYSSKSPEKQVVRVIEPKEPERHVVRTIEAPMVTIRHVHKTIYPERREPEIRKLVVANIAKRRGRIYE